MQPELRFCAFLFFSFSVQFQIVQTIIYLSIYLTPSPSLSIYIGILYIMYCIDIDIFIYICIAGIVKMCSIFCSYSFIRILMFVQLIFHTINYVLIFSCYFSCWESYFAASSLEVFIIKKIRKCSQRKLFWKFRNFSRKYQGIDSFFCKMRAAGLYSELTQIQLSCEFSNISRKTNFKDGLEQLLLL